MDESRSIGILAYDGVDALALIGVHDVITAAADAGCSIEVSVFSLVPSDGVEAASGLGIVPDDVLLGTPDVVVIPGGHSVEGGEPRPTYPDELPERIGQLAEHGATVVGFGAGVLALGEAGILADLSVAPVPAFRERITEYAGSADGEPIVETDRVITAVGPGYAEEVAHRLVEQYCEDDGIDRVERWLGLEN